MENLPVESEPVGRLRKFAIPLLSVLSFLTFFLGIISCEKKTYKFPPHVGGTIDLRYYDFARNPEPIPMDGEWQFYWEEFLLSDPSTSTQDPILVRTQESWMGKDIGRDILPRYGYGTFTTNVLLPVDGKIPKLGIKLPQIASSYRLYVNRTLVHSYGEAGRTREDSRPYIRNHYLPLQLTDWDRNVEIAFEVSNFENDGPGFWQIPKIGPMEKIHKIQVFATANDLFLFGALVVMGFYHWGIYFFHKSQKSILFFSYFSYLLALRVIITGERYILELFPFIDWSLLFRVEFLDLYLLPTSFSIYIFYLFPLETNKKLIHVFSIVVFIFSCTVFLPIHVFTGLAKFFLVFLAFVSFYVLFINILAVYRKREDAFIFLFGLLVLVLSALWDIVQDFRNVRGFSVSPYGFLVFVFIQAIVLSSRLASNFTRTEKLSVSLSRSNKELTHLKKRLEERVEERTRKLQDTLALIRKDLDIAKNIQSKLIPQNSYIWENLEIASIYRSMDEVGGDIFDITEIDLNRKRIFLADALGHGVQAALLTMAIKSEYEGVKFISHSPEDTIRNLSDSFLRKFASLQTYFSCVVLDIDLDSGTIQFASAGHPNQVLISQGKVIELEKTAHILGLDKKIQVAGREFPFRIGDRIFLFSDGVFEQFNRKREILGENALYTSLLENTLLGKSSPEILKIVENQVNEFLGGEKIQDDLTLIGISRV